MPLIESFQRTISGQLEPSEYRLKTKDGEYRWVRSSSRPIYDGDRAIGLRGLLVDLTERKQAEEALRAIVEGTAGDTGSEFFRSLVRHLASALGARYAFAGELAPGDDRAIRTLAVWTGDCFGEDFQYALDGTPCENVLDRDACFYPSGVSGLFPSDDLLQQMGIESYLGMSLFDSMGVPRGVLCVLDDKPMDDTPSARSIMAIFAARAGAELERQQAEEALRESEAKNRALLGAIPDTVVRLRADGTYLDFKAGRDAAFNLPPEGLVGKRLQEVLPADIMEQAMHHIQRALQTGEPQMYEHRFQDGQSESYFEARIVASGHDEVVAIVRDITQRKQAEETIRRLAYHDALTGLPNRALFEDRLSVALAQARRHNQMLAVMFLDLDHFKTVNDTLGHSGGDKLLQSVAQELTLLVRDGDTVARVGGDEFTLLLPNITRMDDATNVAERVLEMLRQPRLLGGHEFQVGTSIGITVFPADGQDAERLLRNADTAMYRAKERGRDNYQLYTPAMNARIIERLALENDLRHALERQELFLLYQPLVEVASGRIVGAEALLRWQHPERGTVLPDEFIPFAEETGLILPIGDWVLETACLQNSRWQEDGHPPIRVTVNLSARQLQQEHLVATVSRVLSAAALEPRYLQLEITEGAVMTNVEHIIAMLYELRTMGVGIAVDDFGTGYSSLSYLKRFPIDAVKIDRSFVRDLATDPNDAAIVTTVIAMSRSLNLKVIAEGVETERQLEFLRDRGCDEFQGYLFGRPVPADQFERDYLIDSPSNKLTQLLGRVTATNPMLL
jgi:diguanylate cyclase (GGDEF)-like protein/PAS domain S-box-containing protein